MMDFKNASKEQLLEEIKRLNKQVSEQSLESESRLQTLFNAMTDIVFEMDYDGTYLNIAPTSAKLMYKIPSEAIGKNLHDVFPKQEADLFLSFIRNCIDENITKTIEYPLVINNETIWFEGTASPKTNNSVLYIARDITKKKESKDQLLESFNTIKQERNMFTQGNVVIFKWKNTEGWPVEYVSENVETVLGYTQNELASQMISYSDIILLDDQPHVNNEVSTFSKMGVNNFTHKPYRIVRKDGTIIWVDDNTTILRNEKDEITHYLGYIVDITLRKNAENSLISALKQSKKSELKLKDAQELSLLGSWELDFATNSLLWSDMVYEIFEIPPKKFKATYESFINLIHPEDRGLVDDAYTNSLITKKPYDIKHRLLLADGKVKYVRERCKTVFDKEGKPKLSSGIIQDITTEEKTRLALGEIETRFRETVNMLPQIVFEIDLAGEIIFVNKCSLDTFGYSQDEIYNNFSFKRTLIPKDWDRVQKNIQDVLTGKEKGNNEYTAVRKDGSTFPCIIYSSAIIKNNKTAGLRGITIDISDRKKAEKESLQYKNNIEESERKFRELFEKSGDAILILENGIFIDCNQATVDILNYNSKEEILNTHPSNLSPELQPDGRNSVEKADEMMSTALNKGSHRFEWEHEKSNGDIFPVEVLLTSISNEPGNQIIHVVWRDISKRLEAAQKIKSDKEFLEQLTNSMWGAVFSVKLPERVIEWANDSYNLLGYETHEFIGNDTSFLYANQTEFKEIGSKIERALVENKDVLHAYQLLKRKNGDVFPAEITLTFHKYKDDVTQITSIVSDISNRVQLEGDLVIAKEKAEQEEEKFRAITTQTTEGITVADTEGNYLIVNPAFCAMSGYTEEELLKLTVFDMKAKDQPHSSFYDSKEKKQGIPIVVNLQKKDGTEYFTEIIGKTIEINNQKLVLGTIRDITQRVKDEQTLRDSEYLLRKSQEAARIGSYVMDLQTGNWIGSQTLNELFGIDENFVYDVERWLSIVHPDDQDEMQKYFSINILTNHEPFNKEYRIKRVDDKKEHWLHGIGELELNEDGVPIKMIGTIQDITKRKAVDSKLVELNKILATQNEEYQVLNEELSASVNQIKVINNELEKSKEQAEESDRLKSAFLANMSHEIRTPMNGILGFADLLKTPNLTGDELKKYTGIIENSGKRMLNIINDLVDISKIEAEQMEVKINECYINKQIEYLHIFFKPEAQKKGINISLNNEIYDNGFTVDTDREKLYAILTNLIKNSIKYTHKGNINIGYSIKNQSKQRVLEFFVKDTGIGIPKERLVAIFERFVQADIEDTEVYEGAGLGLAITKAYVEMLGGEIWVESEEGVGSNFYFTIPYKSNNKELSIHTKIPNQKLMSNIKTKKLKILIAEDEEFADAYLTIILNDISDELFHAKNGAEAVEIFSNNQSIDLILMDIRMPIKSGYKAIEEIREINKDVIIIAQTAYALQGDREKAIVAGCNDYISKPIDRDDLMKIIQKQIKLQI